MKTATVAKSLLTLLICVAPIAGQEANYDEALVPHIDLPDPLRCSDGDAVADGSGWEQKRRPEILQQFRDHVYGHSPKPLNDMHFLVTESNGEAFGGKALRKQVTVYFSADNSGPQMNILIYLPAKSRRPTPTFLGLNFYGNHSINADPSIQLSQSWMRDRGTGIVDNRATETSRGASASRWAVDMIIERGYGLASIYYGDIDPDYHDEFKNGVHPLFQQNGLPRTGKDWGSIAAWSWGLSRAMDYFETDADIDHRKIAVMGHSRLGKTSLWAGAEDRRFAIVISNNSGCGGAALSRRRYGETVKRINTSFPHWFCDNFKNYNDKESQLPVDQHMLIALIAPRPVYIASAEQDRWADPRGEFLSGRYADGVYRLLGTSGIGVTQMPATDEPVMNTIGYHVRSGGHDVTDFDWRAYLDFADQHFGKE